MLAILEPRIDTEDAIDTTGSKHARRQLVRAELRRILYIIEAAAGLAAAVTSQGFTELPISITDGTRAGSLPGPLRDPFDRKLIAQAQALGVALISNDMVFDDYAIRRLW